MKLGNIIVGDILEQDFIKRRKYVIIYLVMIIFAYMYLKFQLQSYYQDLAKAKKELAIERARASTINAERVKITRESNIIQLLNRHNIDITRSYQPPYTIE